MSLRGTLLQIVGNVHPVALPGATLQLLTYFLGQTDVGVVAYEFDSVQAMLLERDQELDP